MGKTPQHILDKNKRWREENREKINAKRREYYQQNKEKCQEFSKEYYRKNGKKRKEYDRAYYLKYRKKCRQEIIENLGGKCIQCGFHDWRGLQIDHVKGGGTKHRKQFTNSWQYYKSILDQLETGEYQLLCANCNQIKRYEQEEVEETEQEK